jgi:tetratricopeptide (TPR) repeat protein/transcriptional regulator with XRE-family HTH domain
MAAVPSPTFGVLLKRYRLAAGLTQEELAAEAGLSRRGIADLELGARTQPRKETVQLLAEALHLSAPDRALLEAAARGRATPAVPTTDASLPPAPRLAPAAPLVGRARELGLLAQMLSDGPPLLLLAGEPGIGKSRLMQAGIEQAEAQGWMVVAGGCHRRSGQDPYAPLVGALASSLRHLTPAQQQQALQGCAWLVGLLPELVESQVLAAPTWTLPPEQERRLMFAAVARYLSNVAGPAGTLLALDDLHWAGADALDLLTSLARTPPERPLRILGAYRDTDIGPQDTLALFTTDLTREGRARHALLAPLAEAEAAALLSELLPEELDDQLHLRQQVLERAGGVPLFLVSCVQALDTGHLTVNGSSHVPGTLREAILQRVVALPQAAQQVLQVAAVIGRLVPRALLLTVATQAAQAEEAVLVALEACRRSRLLVEADEDTYQITHDLIREVLLTDLGTARRAQLHRRVAEALEQGPGTPSIEVLAYHYARSSEVEKALLYMERAGDAARAHYAHTEAAKAYHEVVTRLDNLGRTVEAARVRQKQGEVLGLLGHYDQALAVLDQAAEEAQKAHQLDTELRSLAQIGVTHRWRGTMEEGLRRLQPRLERLSTEGDSAGVAACYAALAQLYLGVGQYQEQLAAASRAARIAASLGDAQTLAVARGQQGLALCMVGELSASYQMLTEEVIPFAEAVGDASTLISTLNNVSVLHGYWGSYQEEQRYIEQALTIARRLGEPRLMVFLVYRLGVIAFTCGQWKQARIDLERAAQEARARGRFSGDNYALYGLGVLSLAQGDEEAASTYFQQAMQTEQRANHRMLHWMRWVLAERDLLAGQPAAACSQLAPILDLPGRQSGYVREILPLLAWAYLELGEEPRAETLLTPLIAEAREAQMRPALGEALRVQALLLSKQQRWEEAQATLEEALLLFQAMLHPYAEAKTLYCFGQVCLQRGAIELAREQLVRAQTILERLDERLYATYIEQILGKSAPC